MTTTQLDHIVLLVDTPFFENLPRWVTDNFTVTPGGYHEGQASRNKLVLFADGSYLEFFNWYDTPPSLTDESLPMRVWGPKPPGLIDFALTDTSRTAEQSVGAVNKRLTEDDKDAGLGIKYGNPTAGGRKKADGVEIKWKVTRPEFFSGEKTPSDEMFNHGRIDVPFFCHDVTSRSMRVPCEDEEKTTHPCGATGIASCDILVPKNLLKEYATVYSKVLGSPAQAVDNEDAYALDIAVPLGSARSKLTVRADKNEADRNRIKERGIGFSDLVLATASGRIGSERRALGESGIGSTIWIE